MLTDIKLIKTQLTKIIKSGVFLCKTLGVVMGNLVKKALIDLAAPLLNMFCLY